MLYSSAQYHAVCGGLCLLWALRYRMWRYSVSLVSPGLRLLYQGTKYPLRSPCPEARLDLGVDSRPLPTWLVPSGLCDLRSKLVHCSLFHRIAGLGNTCYSLITLGLWSALLQCAVLGEAFCRLIPLAPCILCSHKIVAHAELRLFCPACVFKGLFVVAL